jgi:CTP synthase (UTP-ammonia lyase)
MKASDENFMTANIRIGLIGDQSKDVRAHGAIPTALELARHSEEQKCELTWLPTDAPRARERLTAFHGLWCVPGSPYKDMSGALSAIRVARECEIPFLGTCGGFQHALIEFARNVLGISDADHTESNPQTKVPLVNRLSCSLVGARGRIRFLAGSKIASSYGSDEAVESYHCNYGVNPDYVARLATAPLRFAAFDESGQPRGLELIDHPFFVATLFQPELSALTGARHPLIRTFLSSAAARSVRS